MSMPKFTAEASVYRTRGHYHQAAQVIDQNQRALLVAQGCTTVCTPDPPPVDDCVPACVRDCRAAGGIALQCLARCQARCGEE
jgi:hypothetical protein